MAFIPLPQCVEGIMGFGSGGATPSMGFHFDVGHDVIDSDLTNVADFLANFWTTYLRVHMGAGISIVSVKATDVSIEGGHQLVNSTITPAAGSIVSPVLPAQNAVGITWRTARIGRSYRGRTYMPGITEEQVEGNTLTNDAYNDLAADWNTFLGGTAPYGLVLVVASKYHNKAPRTTGELTIVTSEEVHRLIRTQRRRQPVV